MKALFRWLYERWQLRGIPRVTTAALEEEIRHGRMLMNRDRKKTPGTEE